MSKNKPTTYETQLIEAGGELYKMLTNVEVKARQRRPFEITPGRQSMMTAALNQWENAKK